MKHYSHSLNTSLFSYRKSFSYIALGVMIVALFLIHMITIGSITNASFSLDRLGVEREDFLKRNSELSQVLGSKQSLEYLSQATKMLGLEEIHSPVYLELQESSIVVRR